MRDSWSNRRPLSLDGNGRYYLTNIEIWAKELTKEAIENSGRHDIHIDDMPMGPCRDEYVGRYFSIYVVGYRDCSDFWAEHVRLMHTDYWRTYRALREHT